MKWQTQSMGELCQIKAGGTPSRSNSANFDGTIPWVKISDMRKGRIEHTEEHISELGLANSAAKIHPPGTLLLSIFGTVGRTAVLEIAASTNQAVVAIGPRDTKVLDVNYLRLYLDLSVGKLKSIARGVAQSNLNLEILRAVEIPLPPIREQRRIASILEKIEVAQNKVASAMATLSDLESALFEWSFGHPVRNEKKFPTAPLGALLSNIDSGHSPVCMDRPALEGEWGVLKLSAISSGRYVPENNKALLADTVPSVRNLVEVGDILVVRKNTPQLVGASVFVGTESARKLLPDLMFRLVVRDESIVLKRFIQRQLAHESQRQAMQALSGGAVASMSNISKEKLRGLSVLVPPIDLQRDFAEALVRLARVERLHKSRLAQLAEAKAQILEEFFGGN